MNELLQPFSLEGKVALVTGASSGFGRHFATVLAKAGAKVVLAARRTDYIRTAADEIIADGGEAVAKLLVLIGAICPTDKGESYVRQRYAGLRGCHAL